MSELADGADAGNIGHIQAFDDDQLVTLIAAVRLRPGGGATEGEINEFLDWAHRAHMKGLLLELLLDGELAVVGYEDEEPRFAAMAQVLQAEAAAPGNLQGGGEQ
jgi:predicted amidohydrolase